MVRRKSKRETNARKERKASSWRMKRRLREGKKEKSEIMEERKGE